MIEKIVKNYEKLMVEIHYYSGKVAYKRVATFDGLEFMYDYYNKIYNEQYILVE